MGHKRTNGSQRRGGLTRRQFLTYSTAAGLMAGLPSGLTRAADRPTRPLERRLLFFNLSHEADHETATYFVVIGGSRHRLQGLPEKGASGVVASARRTNAFLRGVPDHAFTHVLKAAALPADAVQLCYVIKDPDPTTGQWSMSSLFFHIPLSAMSYAYAQARALTPSGPLPLSAKRQLYGHPPAETLQSLIEEQALQDCTTHAGALIGLHPEILSAEPNSAAHIQTNHIAPNGATIALGMKVAALGAAQPQQTPGQPNGNGWATLRPFTDEQGQPLVNQNGNNHGLIQYNAEWHPQVQMIAGQAMGNVGQRVKNDETLGADVTGALAGGAPPPLTGTIWHRRDGSTSIDQSATLAAPLADSAINYTLTPNTPQDGYNCTATVTSNADGTPHVTLSFENTALRWLGLYIQFLDASNPPNPVIAPNFDYPAASPTTAFLGIVTPEFTILGIPVQSSKATAAFDFPTGVASSAKVLASGLGAGSHTFPDTEGLGIFMTTVFNLVCPPFMIAAGAAQNLDLFVKLGVIPLVTTSLAEFFALLADLKGDVGYQNLLNIFVRALARSGAAILLKIIGALVEYVALAVAEDAIPIAGQIIQGIGAAGAGLEFTETSFEVAHSPWTYEYDLQLTHDLSVTIQPNPQQDDTTPKAANQALVTALFDSGGTPRTQTIDLTQPQSELTVTFTDVPLGGQVNISASFQQVQADPTQGHVLLGKATTGLVSNAVDTLDSVDIDEIRFPIGPNTVYSHKQKSTLDAQGNHLWTAAAAPLTKLSDISCEGPGNLCDFRSITVRQGTGQNPGYVGYAWRGDSASVSQCKVGGQGQLDQLANLNTGATAQTGYTFSPCGLQSGVRLAYSLLSHGAANFYLDPTDNINIIRRVQLEPTPVFDDPTQQRAWGKLNLDSDTLLLHPTGKLISVSNAAHKFESHRPPAAPMSDADAAVHLLAQLHSGQGSRPGLLHLPCAAAISPEGVVIVLEQGNNRLQAFDTGGNPVQFFGKQTSPYFLSLDATSDPDTQYLDLAVEFTGFLYVLSYNQTTNEYRMDLYHPGQSDTQPIATTPDVNAARLTVDFWRNVYTLNYEVLRLPSGNVPPVTEPSVSLWVPTGACETDCVS